jgi:hypothetical protein
MMSYSQWLDLFNDAVGTSYYIVSGHKMINE